MPVEAGNDHCEYTPLELTQLEVDFHFLGALRCTEYAIATACFGGLPARTSAATFFLNAAGDFDFTSGMTVPSVRHPTGRSGTGPAGSLGIARPLVNSTPILPMSHGKSEGERESVPVVGRR